MFVVVVIEDAEAREGRDGLRSQDWSRAGPKHSKRLHDFHDFLYILIKRSGKEYHIFKEQVLRLSN